MQNKINTLKVRPMNIVKGEDISSVHQIAGQKREERSKRLALYVLSYIVLNARCSPCRPCVLTKHLIEKKKGTALWALLACLRRLHLLIRIDHWISHNIVMDKMLLVVLLYFSYSTLVDTLVWCIWVTCSNNRSSLRALLPGGNRTYKLGYHRVSQFVW